MPKKNNFDDLFKTVPTQTPGAFSGIASVVDTVVKKTKRRYGTIPLRNVRPNPFQPRKQFDEQKLEELGDSIKEHGLLEPLVVRESASESGYFELACGERRWRAMQLKHIMDAEAIILDKDCTNEEMEQVALIENVQREDLSPMELALAYDRLRKNGGNGALRSINEVATIVHQSKSTVDDHLAILRAPEDIRRLLVDDPAIPLRIIRDLSNVENSDDRAYLVDEVRSGGLTSNAVTCILQQFKRTQQKPPRKEITLPSKDQPVSVIVNEDVKISDETARTRRPASPALALASLEQKLLRDGKQVQKITQRLSDDIVLMTPKEKQRVRDSVDQWHIWTQQILDLVREQS